VNRLGLVASGALALLLTACSGPTPLTRHQIGEIIFPGVAQNLVATITIGTPIPANNATLQAAELLGYVRSTPAQHGEVIAELTARGRAASKGPNYFMRLDYPSMATGRPTYDILVASPTVTSIITKQPASYDPRVVRVAVQWKYKLTQFARIAAAHHLRPELFFGLPSVTAISSTRPTAPNLLAPPPPPFSRALARQVHDVSTVLVFHNSISHTWTIQNPTAP